MVKRKIRNLKALKKKNKKIEVSINTFCRKWEGEALPK